jgi:hypothetical protein
MKALRTIILGLFLASLIGCSGLMDSAVKSSERLELRAPRTRLGVGESARITVRKKVSWFPAELANPDKTVYSTTSESMLLIEPDGTATCVGTQGKAQRNRLDRGYKRQRSRTLGIRSPVGWTGANLGHSH